jgi:pyruvate ferredoxin oxidoreductase gamma subunit
MWEIRIHGRGGQGAVTTGQILAIAAFHDGKECQTFPMFGVERTGAPVQAFARISNEKIHTRSQVYNPDVVVVLEVSLLDVVDVTKGLKNNGKIIINTNKSPEDLPIQGNFKVHTVDATSIALGIFGKPIVNTPMLGAFSAITKLVSLNSLKKAIDERFLKTKGRNIAELNKKAIEEVYKMSK